MKWNKAEIYFLYELLQIRKQLDPFNLLIYDEILHIEHLIKYLRPKENNIKDSTIDTLVLFEHMINSVSLQERKQTYDICSKINELGINDSYQKIPQFNYSDSELILMIKDFYKSINDKKTLDNYLRINPHLFQFTEDLNSDAGLTFQIIPSKSFILVKNYNSIKEIPIMIHELEHALDFYRNKKYDYSIKSELYSVTSELLMYHYLINQKIEGAASSLNNFMVHNSALAYNYCLLTDLYNNDDFLRETKKYNMKAFTPSILVYPLVGKYIFGLINGMYIMNNYDLKDIRKVEYEIFNGRQLSSSEIDSSIKLLKKNIY